MTKNVVAGSYTLYEWPDGSLRSKPYADYSGFNLADFLGGETDFIDFGDMELASSDTLIIADRVIVTGVNDYTDSLAFLKPSVLPVGRNHFVEAVVEQSGSFSGTFELELHVCCSVAGRSIEVLWQRGGSGLQFVYQNGNKPGFTVLDGSGGTPTPTGGSMSWGDGDAIRAQALYDDVEEEITISTSVNGTPGQQVVIPYASPYAIMDAETAGIGAYVATGNTRTNYCFVRSSVLIGMLEPP
jgi:hypothetical protein